MGYAATHNKRIFFLTPPDGSFHCSLELTYWNTHCGRGKGRARELAPQSICIWSAVRSAQRVVPSLKLTRVASPALL